MKKIVYIDMDGVLSDFNSAVKSHPDFEKKGFRADLIPGIFRKLEIIDGAKEGFEFLMEHFDTYILSTPSWDNYDSWTHKRLWVSENLGISTRKRLILSHNKSLLRGDYLIDDNPWNGAKDFRGEWLQFAGDKFPDWNSIHLFFNKLI